MRSLILAVMVLSGCAGRESRESRAYLNCVYAAQYGPGDFSQTERQKLAEACAK